MCVCVFKKNPNKASFNENKNASLLLGQKIEKIKKRDF